jgi:methionine-rich copper-binding protein CopC
MKQSSKVLLFALLFSIPCKTAFAHLESSKAPVASSVEAKPAQVIISFAADSKAKASEAVTVTLADLRFVNTSRHDDLADVLKQIKPEEESSINQYLAAHATKQSAETRWELVAMVDKVVRDNKMRDMLIKEMLWLQEEFHEFVIRNSANNWKGYSAATKAKMSSLVNKKIKESEVSTVGTK